MTFNTVCYLLLPTAVGYLFTPTVVGSLLTGSLTRSQIANRKSQIKKALLPFHQLVRQGPGAVELAQGLEDRGRVDGDRS